MSGEPGNLVSQSLRLDDRDVIDDALVGVEVTSEPMVGRGRESLTFRSISR